MRLFFVYFSLELFLVTRPIGTPIAWAFSNSRLKTRDLNSGELKKILIAWQDTSFLAEYKR